MGIHRHAKTTPSGRLLMVRRLADGWTVAKVAAALGVTGRTVRKWQARHVAEGEAGLRGGSASLAAIAHALQVSYWWLRDGSGEMELPKRSWPFSAELWEAVRDRNQARCAWPRTSCAPTWTCRRCRAPLRAATGNCRRSPRSSPACHIRGGARPGHPPESG